MTRTPPSCPVCAASVLRQREGGAQSTWDVADRLEDVRRRAVDAGALTAKDAAVLAIAVGCLRIAEFRSEG
jgi:hypothetical protein